jgi:hypothetical protein
MRAVFAALLLVLAASRAAAQEDQAGFPPERMDQPGACFRPRPLPSCSGFAITEFGPLFFLTPSPGDPNDGRTLLFSWELGYMVNRSPTRAIGANVFLAANDNQLRLGARGRYRLWGRDGSALDIGPGIILLNSDSDLEVRGALGLAAQVSYAWRDLLSAVAQAELVGEGVSLQAGGRIGSTPGAILGLGLPVLAFALMRED